MHVGGLSCVGGVAWVSVDGAAAGRLAISRKISSIVDEVIVSVSFFVVV